MKQQAKQQIIEWRPHPGPQETFHRNNSDECGFGGAKGPGKTESILRESLRQVHLPEYRACLFRRTYPQLGEIIDRSFKYFLNLQNPPKYSDKDMQIKLPAWTFPSGAKIAFGSVQHEKDKYNYQGKQFHFMGFDELSQFTESQYLYITAQNRAPKDSGLRCYIRNSFNPGGVGHAWVKQRFIEKLFDPKDPRRVQKKYFKRVNDEDMETTVDDPFGKSRSFVFSTLFDNPSVSFDYLRTLKQLSETEQKAFIEGDWDSFQGQFFTMWRSGLHIQDREINSEFVKFISLDYGYGAPASVGWWQVDYDGNMHRYREFYSEGFTYEALAKKIRELTPDKERIAYCVADPAIWGDRTHHKDAVNGESGAETMGNVWRGFTALVKGDNDRIIGWGRMRILLDKKGALTTSPRCVASIRTIPTLIHDEIKVEDVNTDGEDHAADDWRYAVMSRPFAPEKKEEKPQAYSLDHFEKQEEYAESLKPRKGGFYGRR